MSGIYIHIPFCRQACSYCDFYFVTRQVMREPYVEALLEEIEEYEGTDFAKEPVETIYFGGGTPSRLSPSQIGQILRKLRSVFDVQAREITLEMNPDDVIADYLLGLKQAGVTRASMGVQSFQPELLEAMNRAHTRVEALQCLELLSQSDFEAFTVDLIYGNPNQSMVQLEEDLERLLDFDPPHISAYSLTVEPDTRLGKQVELGRITPPPDDTVAEQFEMINRRLEADGIKRYEVSNYSRPGAEAVHNSHYWTHENYLGLGPGAHSFWWNDDAHRWQNPADIKAYIDQPRVLTEEESLSLHQLAEERIMMGLRTREGVSETELRKVYDYALNESQSDYLRRKEDQGLLRWDDDICLTDEGILLADALVLDLITLKKL